MAGRINGKKEKVAINLNELFDRNNLEEDE